MLKRIMLMKGVVQDYAAAAPELHASEAMWTQFQQLTDVLEQPYAATIRLQSDSFTPGAFMKEWMMLNTTSSSTGQQSACSQPRCRTKTRSVFRGRRSAAFKQAAVSPNILLLLKALRT